VDDGRKIDPGWAWSAYEPGPGNPWDEKKAGHLLRRAGFGFTLAELEAAVNDGPKKTLARLLAPAEGMERFEKDLAPIEEVIARTNNGGQLRAWWLTRMLYSPHPLREKVTLFWHNHFATSQAKVRDAALMIGQYRLMYRHALGDFSALLRAMAYDPAMLVWLDGAGSKKGSPNENYARELMELFSLGIGHYSEKDIREAARAFTGWTVADGKAVFDPKQHDDGEKAVLGRKGKLGPDDVAELCLAQPACPHFLCARLFRWLVSDVLEPTRELLAPLAKSFRESKWDMAALVERMLASNLFHSRHAYRSRVKSPIEFALGTVRALEGRVGTVALADELEKLGQNVFSPPSVKGWDGGQAWLNGQTLLYRQNLALAFCSTEDPRFGSRLDPAALARRHGKKSDEELVDFFLRLFLQGDVPAKARQRLLDVARKSHGGRAPVFWTAEDVADRRARSLAHLVLSLPEYQLG
jgi:uncharacterized protein (DUF1800 family)